MSVPAKSPGRRFIGVGFLVLLMFIPMFFAAEVVDDRRRLSENTLRAVSEEWGGAQTLAGPFLQIPVMATVTQVSSRPKVDPETGLVLVDPETGKEQVERFEETVQQAAAPVTLLPESFDAQVTTETEIRSRGIFTVPVYRAEAGLTFDFDTEAAEPLLHGNETLLWEQAELVLGLSSNRALRGASSLTVDGTEKPLESRSGAQGIRAAIGDPRGATAYALTFDFNGAEQLFVAPVGRESSVTLTSDWPHPSFRGAFLPDNSTVTNEGFTASWTIPHLARALPQASRDTPEADALRSAFGVDYFEPNDFYQKAYRAARYGVLFIALTFLTILLIERGSERPAHAVQYILVGLVQTVFVLLMVSYAEHIGFAAAYALSAGAVTALLTLFGVIGLKLGRRALVLGCALLVVYAVLYFILQLADYALLAGSTLAFLALAVTMILTRNEDWHGPEGERRPGFLSRALRGAAPTPPQS